MITADSQNFWRAVWKSKTPQIRLPSVFEQITAELRDDIVRRRNHFAANTIFNAVIICTIFINTLVIGLEVDYARGTNIKDRLPFFVIEFAFALLFFFEMLVRLNQQSWDYFLDPWNLFDYFLVVLSFSDIVIAIVTMEARGTRLASSLRIFRLLRVVRGIKGVKMVAGLWLIIQGILDCVYTVFWMGSATIFFIYIFGVVIATTCGQDPQIREYWHLTDVYVGTVRRAMITILQVMTLDGWIDDIGRPIFYSSSLTVIILILCVWILTFGTLNILIGVIVERVLTISQEGKDAGFRMAEKTEQALLQSMAQDFWLADRSGRAELTYRDFQRMIRSQGFKRKLKLVGIRIDEAEQLFQLMDADQSGTLSPGEFVSGLQRIKGPARGQDVVQLISFAQKQSQRAAKFTQRLKMLNQIADDIQLSLKNVGMGISAEVGHRNKAKQRSYQTFTQMTQRHRTLSQIDFSAKHDFPFLMVHEESD
jgi:voltage-gated sodium channel